MPPVWTRFLFPATITGTTTAMKSRAPRFRGFFASLVRFRSRLVTMEQGVSHDRIPEQCCHPSPEHEHRDRRSCRSWQEHDHRPPARGYALAARRQTGTDQGAVRAHVEAIRVRVPAGRAEG